MYLIDERGNRIKRSVSGLICWGPANQKRSLSDVIFEEKQIQLDKEKKYGRFKKDRKWKLKK